MASTYTTNGGIEKIATGEQSGTWGDTTNTNFDIIDRLTNGVGSITLSGTTHSLTTVDGALSDGMYRVLVLGGSPSGTNTITVGPNNAQKFYLVQNSSGQSVIFTQGSGSNVTVVNGKSDIIYCDGAGSGAAVVSLLNTVDLSAYAQKANNLSDLASAATALTNLGLTTAAKINYNNITTLGTSEANKTVTADANGNIKVSEEVQAKAYLETVVALSAAASVTLDLSTGNVFTLTTGQATTFVFNYANIQLTTGDAFGFTLRVLAGGAHNLIWPSAAGTSKVFWAGGTAPDAPASGDYNTYVFYTVDGGVRWDGAQAIDAGA